MKRIHSQWVSMLGVALLSASSALWAADVTTLRGAVEEAVMRNPEVLEQYHRFRAASEEVGVARGGLLPRLDLTGTYGSETLKDDGPDREDTYIHATAGLSLRQLLFDGFATRNDVRRLRYAQRVRYYEVLAAAEKTALEATQAYYDVLRYQKLFKLAQDNYATHKEVYEHVRQRTEAGIGRGVDLEQATARWALAESNLITEASNLHDVSARFERVVGVMPPALLSEPPTLDGKLPPAQELMAGEFRRAPEMNAALENIRAARRDLAGKKGAYWPRLELRASVDHEHNLDNQIDNRNRGRLEIGMNYNLFNGLADRARVKQHHEKVYEALDVRDKVCRDLRQNTRIAWNDTEKLAGQIQHQDQHQLSTAKARDAYRQQFDIGQRTLLDLLDSENELYDARRTYLSSQAELEVARARVLAPNGYLLSTLGLNTVGQGDVDTEKDPLGDADRVACAMDAPMQVAKPADRPVTPLPKRRKLASFTLKADTLFAFDKADLSAQGRSSLDGLVDGLMGHAQHKDRTINVHGYTDRLGSDAYNQRLSDRRAETVRNYLLSKGLPGSQVTAQGHGESDPVTGDSCVGETPTPTLIACLQPDRRVIIDVEGTEEVTIQYDPEQKQWTPTR